MATEKTAGFPSHTAYHTENAPTEANHHHLPTTVPKEPAYAEHGALIDHKVSQEDVVQAEPDLPWSRVRRYLREPFSEFFGTFILVMFGDGVVAQVVLSNGKKGDYQSISWGWG
jgi:aquaglyceroporin related protein, other eukaryote